jgi:hypothetical protein
VAYFEGDFSHEELELMHIQFLSDVGNWWVATGNVLTVLLFCIE